MNDNYVRHALDVFAGHGDAEAIVTAGGERISYRRLRGRVLDTAAALWEHGIRPGMTIGMLVTRAVESYYVQLGAHLLGCRTVFLMPISPPVFLEGVLRFSGADAFVYQKAITGERGRELAEAAAPLPVFCLGPGGLGPDLAAAPAVDALPFDPAAITAEPESLFQTSGTTGTPKLVRHGPRYFRTIPAVAGFYRPDDGRPFRHLHVASAWHAGAQGAALLVWLAGGTLVLNEGWHAETFLATLERERITSANVSPQLLYELLDHPRLAGTDLSSLWTFTISSSSASPARLTQAIDRFGLAAGSGRPRPVLSIVYGMSELPFATALPRLDHDPAHPQRLSSCGKPWGDVRVEIRDAAGTVVPPGQPGEIWLASDLAMEGYFGDPEETAQTLVDGWLRTGDVGRVDADGYLYILDRAKDVVISDLGSTMIYCRPLEDTLAEHPQVRAAAVIGVPDDALGEIVYAYVVPAPGATVTTGELRQFVVERLNEQWSPREVEFVDALPLNESGKVDKRSLRDRHPVTAARP